MWLKRLRPERTLWINLHAKLFLSNISCFIHWLTCKSVVFAKNRLLNFLLSCSSLFQSLLCVALQCTLRRRRRRRRRRPLFWHEYKKSLQRCWVVCKKKIIIIIKSLSTIKRIIKIKTAIASYMYTIYSKTITYRWSHHFDAERLKRK